MYRIEKQSKLVNYFMKSCLSHKNGKCYITKSLYFHCYLPLTQADFSGALGLFGLYMRGAGLLLDAGGREGKS